MLVPLVATVCKLLPLGLLALGALATFGPQTWGTQGGHSVTKQSRQPLLVRLPLDRYPDARCLDGTAGGYYLRKGIGVESSNKWVIFLEGWGFCSSAADCLQRSRGEHGSSSQWPETWDFEEPYLSLDPALNPLTHDWNVAYLKTCDGAYFAGTRGRVATDGGVVYFSGEAILRAALQQLGAAGLLGATEVVVGGNSAGGISVLSQLDEIRKMLPQGARVSGFSDSGFYLPTARYVGPKRFVTEGQHAGRLLPARCLEDNEGQPWRCFVSSVAAAYLETPVFAWQSRYDTDQRDCELEEDCRRSADCVNEYGNNLTLALEDTLWVERGMGFFLEGCSHHCWSVSDPVELPRVDGRTAMEAFAEWYGGGRASWRQEGRFPCDRCCPPRHEIFP